MVFFWLQYSKYTIFKKFQKLPGSIIRRVFWELNTDYILSAVLCPWSPWSEEISSITRLFSVHQYSNMPWINTGSMQGSPVGVTLKGLTLWLPSWCEGLERLPTFNIWTSRTPPHQAILLNTSSYTQAHTHTCSTPSCSYLSPLHTHHAHSRLNLTERLGLLAPG